MIKKFSLVTWIFIFIGIGLGTGLLIRETGEFGYLLGIAEFVATVFIRLLKMIIVPLVITSIITGIVGISHKKSLGRMGLRTVTFYISTSLIAIVTGLILVNIFKPGLGVDLGLKEVVEMQDASAGDILDIFIRMIPVNFLEAATQGQMLPIIFFCILFGFFITQANPEHGTFLRKLFSSCFDVMMHLTQAILKLAPIGIWGLFTKLVATTGFEAFIPLGKYSACVLLALAIHTMVTLPLIVYIIGRANPYQFFLQMRPALLTAFSTSSSSATLPISLETIEYDAGVSNRVSSFVLPLGATINMDGTALYECIAVIFIAQAYGVDLSIAQQGMIILTALMASIGAAGIPMAGLVMMSIILNAVGLPLEGVGLIIAVDRVLDMFRTTTNVWSDCCCAYTVASLEKEVYPVSRLRSD